MRILVVTSGLEPLLHHTVVGLAARGHDVHVVGARSPDELDPVERFRHGAALTVRGGEGGGALRQTLRTGAQFARGMARNGTALRRVIHETRRGPGSGKRPRPSLRGMLPALEVRADVVYIEAANVAAEHAAILKHLGPKVVMCTGSDVRVLPDETPWLAQALPAVFAQMARVVCRSEDLRRWAVRRGAPEERTEVLYPAVDTTFFSTRPRPARAGNALRLVSVGRVHWIKAFDDAIQAVWLARRAGHDVTLTLVGADRGSTAPVDYAVRDLGLEEHVTRQHATAAAGVRAALARADAYLLSSVGEGVSRAALEAMAMGLPVVTTDAGGMPEVVEDGAVGFVVPRRDPRALAEAIGALASDPGRREAMGARARAHAAAFDTTTHLDRIEGLLVEVAGYGRVDAGSRE